jgi:anti-sigma factor RsiW
MNDHLTPDILQLLADRELPEEQAVAARVHLISCPQCASAAQKIQRFDRVVRRLPLRRSRTRFTQDVLAQLHIVPRAPLAFRILEHAGSVFGVVLVLSILMVVYVSATNPGRGSEGMLEGVSGKVLQSMDSALDQALAAFSGWLADAAPQVFGHGAIEISLMLLIMVPAIALIDRLWGRKRMIGG